MVPLGEEEFENGAAVFLKALGDSGDLHAFKDGGYAGGKELVVPFDLHHAQTAGADIAQAIEMAEGRNFDVVFARHLKDGLTGAGADFLFIDDECFDVN
jgi:hypothetical protein